MKYKLRAKTSKRLSRKLGVSLAVVLVAVVVTIPIIVMSNRNDKKKHKTAYNGPTFVVTSTGQSVNVSPPTEADKANVDNNKQAIDKNNSLSTASGNSSSAVKNRAPSITYAGQSGSTITVNGYIAGVFEDGGTCTATFTQAEKKITKQTKGFSDANHTTCEPFSVSRSDFPSAGTWSVTLAYNSATSTGTSQSTDVVVQ